MTADDLLEVCIAEIEDGNQTFVSQLLSKARAKILAGGGEIAPLETGELSAGKKFTRDVRMDAAQVARVCRQALDEADGNIVAGTCLDFSDLAR